MDSQQLTSTLSMVNFKLSLLHSLTGCSNEEELINQRRLLQSRLADENDLLKRNMLLTDLSLVDTTLRVHGVIASIQEDIKLKGNR